MATLTEAQAQLDAQAKATQDAEAQAQQAQSQLESQRNALPNTSSEMALRQTFAGQQGMIQRQVIEQARGQIGNQLSDVQNYQNQLKDYQTNVLQPYGQQIKTAQDTYQHQKDAYTVASNIINNALTQSPTGQVYYNFTVPPQNISDPLVRSYVQQFMAGTNKQPQAPSLTSPSSPSLTMPQSTYTNPIQGILPNLPRDVKTQLMSSGLTGFASAEPISSIQQAPVTSQSFIPPPTLPNAFGGYSPLGVAMSVPSPSSTITSPSLPPIQPSLVNPMETQQVQNPVLFTSNSPMSLVNVQGQQTNKIAQAAENIAHELQAANILPTLFQSPQNVPFYKAAGLINQLNEQRIANQLQAQGIPTTKENIQLYANPLTNPSLGIGGLTGLGAATMTDEFGNPINANLPTQYTGVGNLNVPSALLMGAGATPSAIVTNAVPTRPFTSFIGETQAIPEGQRINLFAKTIEQGYKPTSTVATTVIKGGENAPAATLGYSFEGTLSNPSNVQRILGTSTARDLGQANIVKNVGNINYEATGNIGGILDITKTASKPIIKEFPLGTGSLVKADTATLKFSPNTLEINTNKDLFGMVAKQSENKISYLGGDNVIMRINKNSGEISYALKGKPNIRGELLQATPEGEGIKILQPASITKTPLSKTFTTQTQTTQVNKVVQDFVSASRNVELSPATKASDVLFPLTGAATAIDLNKATPSTNNGLGLSSGSGSGTSNQLYNRPSNNLVGSFASGFGLQESGTSQAKTAGDVFSTSTATTETNPISTTASPSLLQVTSPSIQPRQSETSLSRLSDLSLSAPKQSEISIQVPRQTPSLNQPQRNEQRLFTRQETQQVQQQRQTQQLTQQTKQTSKLKNPLFPPIPTSSLTSFIRKVASKTRGIYTAAVTKNKKLVEIGKYPTEFQAESAVKNVLKNTILASGEVLYNGKPVPPQTLGGDFRMGKRNQFLIVEKKGGLKEGGQGRLSTRGAVADILAARNSGFRGVKLFPSTNKSNPFRKGKKRRK